MTKKDYMLLASALNETLEVVKSESDLELFFCCFHSISNKLHSDNPKFNKNIFRQACGIPEVE